MSKEEIKQILMGFGLPEDAAEHYAKLEVNDKKFAWLSAFRFVRPLNNSLEFYKNEYGDILRSRVEKGLSISDSETELLNAGATPEMLGKFASEIALSAFCNVLYRLSDAAGADYDLEGEGADLPSWTLMERDSNYVVTERYVTETHSLIPFSNL
jgi:hypothetical protein